MRKNMDRWTELRTAYSVAQLGTVSAAAEKLNLHRATVNRHIDALEDALGGRIFIRHARGYVVTELGQELIEVAKKTDAMLADVVGRVRSVNSIIDGEVQLTIIPPMSNLVVNPVARFRELNPNCLVKINATYELAKLEHGEAHVALRIGPKPDSPDYVVRPFTKLHLSLYAHESYLQTHGPIDLEKSFDGLRFVLPPADLGHIPFQPWVKRNVTKKQIAVIANSPAFHFQSIKAGTGIGFLPDFEVAAHDGFLRLLSDRENWFLTVWLVTHVDVTHTDRVQSLLRCFFENQATFFGENFSENLEPPTSAVKVKRPSKTAVAC